jgi:hypothetical protein
MHVKKSDDDSRCRDAERFGMRRLQVSGSIRLRNLSRQTRVIPSSQKG